MSDIYENIDREEYDLDKPSKTPITMNQRFGVMMDHLVEKNVSDPEEAATAVVARLVMDHPDDFILVGGEAVPMSEIVELQVKKKEEDAANAPTEAEMLNKLGDLERERIMSAAAQMRKPCAENRAKSKEAQQKCQEARDELAKLQSRDKVPEGHVLSPDEVAKLKDEKTILLPKLMLGRSLKMRGKATPTERADYLTAQTRAREIDDQLREAATAEAEAAPVGKQAETKAEADKILDVSRQIAEKQGLGTVRRKAVKQ